ncbi:MAG: phosphoglycerate dehydrogenase [Alphaproteobacteria bacterium]|nr:phosphoglycerate dehydrogenase [Alphaproteobacteria bacterium]
MSPRVLISDELSPRAVEIFAERGVAVDNRPGLKADALLQFVGDYDGLAIRSATKVTAEVLTAGRKLRVVGRAGIGVDNVDLPAASQRGVVVMNTPYGNAITTAEHAIALMLALARQIPQANASTQAGKWEKTRFMGVELDGKTLGVIGCGNVGSIVVDRAIGLKMRVLVYDPFLASERAAAMGARKAELDELLAKADFVTLHTPMTEQTKGMIDARAIAKMRDGARIVNCARGGLVVEADLRAALDSGKLAGAALDVFSEEPARANALFGHPNVICTPHLGASTVEAQEKVAAQIAEQMADYLLTGAVTNALNMPSVTREEAPKLAPYMKLAEQLGRFAGQITKSDLRSVSIEYEGHVASLNTRPVTAAALLGLLAPSMDSVNMVNAPVVAKARGITVAETKVEGGSGDYQTLIRLRWSSERGARVIAGTLFANQRPRIVHLDGIDIETETAPHMLLVQNQDKPGMVGALGTLLGDAGINIATFQLGRTAPGGQALALCAVDSPIPEGLIARICALPLVTRVLPLRF